MAETVVLNDHGEVPDRLEPKAETKRALFEKSGNECAFPDCTNPIYDGYTLVGERCHIEDALPGCRWNPARTNEQNREESNLVLFCRICHVSTNDPDEYSTARLREIKAAHEEAVVVREKQGLSPAEAADFQVTKRLFMQLHVDAVGEYINEARRNFVVGKYLIFYELFHVYFTAPFAMFHDEKLNGVFQEFYDAWGRLVDIGMIEEKDTATPNIGRVRVDPKNPIESQEVVDVYQYWADESDQTFRKLLKYIHAKFPSFDFRKTNGYAWSQYLESIGE